MKKHTLLIILAGCMCSLQGSLAERSCRFESNIERSIADFDNVSARAPSESYSSYNATEGSLRGFADGETELEKPGVPVASALPLVLLLSGVYASLIKKRERKSNV